MITNNSKQIRQRKFLLVLPLIILPFATFFFWSLGGGRGNGALAATPQKGLNTKLPGAQLKDDSTANKLSFYQQAEKDSVKFRQARKDDPNYKPDSARHGTLGTNALSIEPSTGGGNYGSLQSGGSSAASLAVNEQKINRQLAALNRQINKPATTNIKSSPADELDNTNLERLRSALQKSNSAPDPEMLQMNAMLEKILQIQHPELIKAKANDVAAEEAQRFRAIPAVVDGKQKITQGTVVRLRLLDTVTLNGRLIPKGQLIYGSGTLYNQRMTLAIKNIRLGYEILPVDLTVFDMTDGLEGISVPEAITSDALKEGSGSAVQDLQIMSMDPSMTTQLAGAGINAAKGLFSKKVKRIKAKLQDGHTLLLRDNKKVNVLH